MHRLLLGLALLLLPTIASADAIELSRVFAFPNPIDALSIELPSADAVFDVSGFDGHEWSPWQELHREDEQDPALRESNLVIFPKSITKIRLQIRNQKLIIRNPISNLHSPISMHPIRLSHAPAHYRIASTAEVTEPHILTRKEWGADESLLIEGAKTTRSDVVSDHGNTGGTAAPETVLPERVSKCQEDHANYPYEFQTVRPDTTTPNGKKLRWPREYSPHVRLLVVHHTALPVTGDARPGVERMRALYAYHANNRGWGDIGYHFVIDETGQIYEGRSGGANVVGGHVYCANASTVGIAMMGNFEEEQPTQEQLKSLQWLLATLASQYDINLDRTVWFHGKTFPAIVGHRDLLSTDCPGYYSYGILDQVRAHVRNNEVSADVNLLPLRSPAEIPKEQPAVPEDEAATDPHLARLVRKIRTAQRLNPRLAGTRMAAMPTKRTRASVSSLPPVAPAGAKWGDSSRAIRIHLSSQEHGAVSCNTIDLSTLQKNYRGAIACQMLQGKPALINTLALEEYLMGLSEEPDTELFEKQRAFAIAARTYAAYYRAPDHRKFPGLPYDGTDDPALFQAYGGKTFEVRNPQWVRAVRSTDGKVLTKDDQIIRAPYFSSDAGQTRTPAEAGWNDFPFAEIFTSKPDPWCAGHPIVGHGVGMSGCGAGGQAREGKTAEEILRYYYPETELFDFAL